MIRSDQFEGFRLNQKSRSESSRREAGAATLASLDDCHSRPARFASELGNVGVR
jgi:hypothetical protein